jgi:hypothetical protein
MFQSASKKEIKRIACGAVLLTVAMWVVYALLGVFGVAALNGKIVLSSLVGDVVAVGNFAALCLMVQKAAAAGDDKGRAKAIVQLSYNLRLTVQAVWVVLAFVLPCFSVIAGAVPLLFPRLVIYYLQLTGQYKGETGAAVSTDPAEAEDETEAEEPESPEQQSGQDTMS